MSELKAAFDQIVLERRSVKRYDSSVKIPKEQLTQILEEATRAPSAINLQPWRLLVVDSEEGKNKLIPLAGGNEDQVRTSSATIAVFADLEYAKLAKDIYAQTVAEGKMPAEIADHILNIVTSYIEPMPEADKKLAAILDVGLFCQQLMITARAYGYDTCPIGGFDKTRINDVFGLDERLLPVLLISIGKEGDPGKPSSRLPLDKIAQWV